MASTDTFDSLAGIPISGGSVLLRERSEGSLAVKVYIDGRKIFEKEAKQKRDSDPNIQWDLNPPIILKHGSNLAIKLAQRKPYHLTGKIRAEASASFDDFQRLISSSPGEIKELKLYDNPTVTINVIAKSPDTLREILNDAVKVSEGTKTVLDRLGRAKGFLETVMTVGALASEAHPIAKTIFSCVNIVYEKLKNQEQCNELVLDLANDMAYTLGYIEDVKQFARLAQLKQALKDVTPLMEDATNFIVEYTRDGKVRSLLSEDKRNEVNGLTKGFNRFKQQFDRGVSVQSGKNLEMLLKDMGTSLHLWYKANTHRQVVESTKDDKWLDELKPEGPVRGRPTAEFMDGTRKDIIAKIDEWCEDLKSSSNILWVSGSPGVGKSAISRKLATRLKSSHRFGSSLFFQRELASAQTPSNLWRAIAYDLSREYPSARNVIVTKLKDGEIDLGNTDAMELFRSLVEDPLNHSTDIPSGRLPVIVIDAMDECGGLDGSRSKHRNILLQGMKAWARLGPRFKLIVTSRPEDDISRTLSAISQHIELGSGQNVSPSSSQDIHAFLSREFTRIANNYRSLSPGWPGDSVINDFTKRSAGLFIYADTLVKFVDEGEPTEQLDRIFSKPLSLTELYKEIIRVSFKDPSTGVLEAFRNVTGTIILAKIPLRRQDIGHLLNLPPTTLDHICRGLQSVLDNGDLLRFTHQSFVDFLMDSTGCLPSFLFDNTIQSRTLLLGSLRVMKDELKFNICKLETSHTIHDNIPNLEMRIHANISAHLQYACGFWTDHIQRCDFDAQVAKAVELFMLDQFLYWLEVMSLLRKMNRVTPGLRSVTEWSGMRNNQITNFMADAAKFVAAFVTPITQSVPHIYLSAIPFAPKGSAVAQTYHRKYMNTLSLCSGKALNWPAIQNILYGSSEFECVAFSPDGSRIVSGSWDRTVRLWDAETGDSIGKPLVGHSNWVASVAFSPDGSRIVSGSHDETVRLWDAETGDPIGRPLQGHSGYVLSVAFSPNGLRIVSGSEDNTIRLWDAWSGAPLGKQLKGHSHFVNSVAFSPNGLRIVSGSGDKTIRLWDAETGRPIGRPLEGHSGSVRSVAFSPNGTFIVSGSSDNTVRLWDAKTGGSIGKPFQGHSETIISVAFSPDGSRIVSGSHDETVRLWDAETGDPIGRPLQGHSSRVPSVAFSPNGLRIVSGSEDKTIRLWDTETGQVFRKPQQGHSDLVTSVTFSPNGSCIMSGSWDKTICLWDTKTGDPIGKPLIGHSHFIASVAFSPNGSFIVSGSEDHTICLWDAKTGDLIGKPFQGHSGGVTSVTFSPDGCCILSGSSDKTIRLWDAKRGNAIGNPLEGHFVGVISAAFSPNGSCIVSSSWDNTIRLWDAKTGHKIGNPIQTHFSGVPSAIFSPDGSCILSSWDQSICLWDVETGDLIHKLHEGHSNSINSATFSPNGSQIVSGSSDKTICLWDTRTGDLIGKPLQGHSNHVTGVAFSPDGSCIVSSSSDKTIRLWDAKNHDFIRSLPLEGSHIMSGLQDNTHHLQSKAMSNVVPPKLASTYYSQLLPSGWVVNSELENLFWVPPWNRLALCLYKNMMTISQDENTILDMSKFTYGTAWEKCRTS